MESAGARAEEPDQPAGGATNGGHDVSAPPGIARGPKVQIRTFEGDPAQYKEWRREVEASAFLYSVPEEQLAGLVYLALAPGEGKPRDLFSHLDVRTDICVPDGLDRIWKILDQEFAREAYVKADEAQTRYDRCRRSHGQTMEEYLRESRLSKRI